MTSIYLASGIKLRQSNYCGGRIFFVPFPDISVGVCILYFFVIFEKQRKIKNRSYFIVCTKLESALVHGQVARKWV